MSLGGRIRKKNAVIRLLAQGLADQKNKSDGMDNGLGYTADELIERAYRKIKHGGLF